MRFASALLLLLLLSCTSWVTGCRAPPPAKGKVVASGPTHTLILGGDIFASRTVNQLLFTDAPEERLFSDVRPLLRSADLTVANLEGVVALGGRFYKPSTSTYMFHAHPRLLDVLQDAGIDVVTLGNNHIPDYGPDALVEMTDRILLAGLDYVGAGLNRADARRPVYRRVGDVVVALIGGELTYASRYAATATKPGGHFIKRGLMNDDDDDAIFEAYRELATQARRHAHVIIASPHWDAWETPPAVTPRMRRLAKRLLTEGGFDAILAHGRHEAQGIELFEGKPVLYDAGNLTIDYGGRSREHQALLWMAHFNKAGVVRLEATALKLGRNHTRLATGDEQDRILQEGLDRCRALGTEAQLQDGRLVVRAAPPPARAPVKPSEPLPQRTPPPALRVAPQEVVLTALPPDVTPVDVRWEGGLRLVGYKIVAEALARSRPVTEVVLTYWTTDQPLTDHYLFEQGAWRTPPGDVPLAEAIAAGTTKGRDHHHRRFFPGDWLFPTTRWTPGTFIQQWTNFRIKLKETAGDVTLVVGVRRLGKTPEHPRGGVLLKAASSSAPLIDGRFAVLGTVPFADKPPRLRDRLEQLRKSRRGVLQLAERQPW